MRQTGLVGDGCWVGAVRVGESHKGRLHRGRNTWAEFLRMKEIWAEQGEKTSTVSQNPD